MKTTKEAFRLLEVQMNREDSLKAMARIQADALREVAKIASKRWTETQQQMKGKSTRESLELCGASWAYHDIESRAAEIAEKTEEPPTK